MPSPFTFFKNLTNHREKDATGSTTPEHGSPVKYKGRKLRKSSIQHPPQDQHHQNTEREKGDTNVTDALPDEHKDNSVYQIPFHPSIPDGSTEGWRAFPPPHRVETIMMRSGRPVSQPRQSAVPSENPMIVSRYYPATQTEYLQPRNPEPVPPSRTWSPIPTVKRESSHVRRTVSIKDDGRTSFVPTEPQGQNTPFRRSTTSKRSTILTVGQQPSEHDRRFIEYPVILEQNEHLPPGSQTHDENKTLKRAVQETIQPKISNRNTGTDYSPDSDQEVEIYHYIVPAGVDVIFQDEEGSEITRVGKITRTPPRHHPLKSAPIVVHDEFGELLYRDPSSAASGSRSTKRSYDQPSNYPNGLEDIRPKGPISENRFPPWLSPSNLSSRSKIIKIDKQGNQIPM